VDTITEADLTDLRRYLRSPLDNLGFEINEYSIGFLQYVVEETILCPGQALADVRREDRDISGNTLPAEEAYEWYVARIRNGTIRCQRGDSITIKMRGED